MAPFSGCIWRREMHSAEMHQQLCIAAVLSILWVLLTSVVKQSLDDGAALFHSCKIYAVQATHHKG